VLRVAEVELWRIYLDRSLHSRGVAQRLLRELGAEARSMGASWIWLAVRESTSERSRSTRNRAQSFHVGGEVQRDLVLRGPEDAF